MAVSTELRAAFEHCERIARQHYENFPVASFFIPRDYRAYVSSIYAFARTADDFADEEALPPEGRLRRLDDWQRNLDACYEGTAAHPIFLALAETVARNKIPKKPLADLLAAFRMDVTTHRYQTFDDLLRYCSHSADPVGYLVLSIFQSANPSTIQLSNSICTGLQLANFWQDVAVDWRKGRVYIPLEDVHRFGYTEQDLGRHVVDDRFRSLLEFQVERTKGFFERGKPLLTEVARNLRFELALTWKGGMGILSKIEQQRYDVLTRRPSLSWADKLSILVVSAFRRGL